MTGIKPIGDYLIEDAGLLNAAREDALNFVDPSNRHSTRLVPALEVLLTKLLPEICQKECCRRDTSEVVFYKKRDYYVNGCDIVVPNYNGDSELIKDYSFLDGLCTIDVEAVKKYMPDKDFYDNEERVFDFVVSNDDVAKNYLEQLLLSIGAKREEYTDVLGLHRKYTATVKQLKDAFFSEAEILNSWCAEKRKTPEKHEVK